MAVPRYKLQTTLHHHTDTITTLQFSPSESFLASGSENGVIIIFSTQSWKPIKRFINASPVASLLWHPSFPKTLLCGFSSGDIHTACFEGNDTVDSDTLHKVWSDPMNGAIHCLVSNGDGTVIAVGHGTELSIVTAKTISTWFTVRRLPDPPSLPGLDEDEELPPPSVRSLHFIGSGKMLIATYLDHGFACWDMDSFEIVWHLVPRTCCIGRSTVSLDEKTLVVLNLYDGLDWYNIQDRIFSRAVPIRIVQNKPIPVLFIDNGNAIMVGGSSGAVWILDSRTAETMQTLEHSPDDLIQAMVYHSSIGIYHGQLTKKTKDFHQDSKQDSRLIATGVSESGRHTKIRIWEAVAERKSETPDPIPDPTTTNERPSRLKQYLLRMGASVFIYFLALCLPMLDEAIRVGLGASSQWVAQRVWSIVDPTETSYSGTMTPIVLPPPTARSTNHESIVTITVQAHETD